jgi:hypothetical protein
MWEISRKDGWSVAHAAALHGHLPPDVPDAVLRSQWLPCEHVSVSVADVVNGEIPTSMPKNCRETRERARQLAWEEE